MTWTNIVIPEVAKVAETLAEFRGRYKYNLLDEHVRRFNAEVPQIWQWDDHEDTVAAILHSIWTGQSIAFILPLPTFFLHHPTLFFF